MSTWPINQQLRSNKCPITAHNLSIFVGAVSVGLIVCIIKRAAKMGKQRNKTKGGQQYGMAGHKYGRKYGRKFLPFFINRAIK